MSRYHVALSFAGEDRDYVERTAIALREHGVDVFYDKFEETKLWGKNLYDYLTDVYQNKAIFTIMFVSEAYKNKLWTNHERKSAQAKAFSQNKECILPAMLEEGVEVPGLLGTTGYIDLKDKTPEEFAGKIIQKLEDEGILLAIESKYAYSDEARSDADFPMPPGDEITEIIGALRSYNWPTQKPAVQNIFTLDFDAIGPDDLFVLGRNIYQCACGSERTAISVLRDLRRRMAALPPDAAIHLVNGMFYEVYFDANGNFRGPDLKSRCIEYLFAVQNVSKFRDCVEFIRRALQPYRDDLFVLPNVHPEIVNVNVCVLAKDPPEIKEVVVDGMNLLLDDEDEDPFNPLWKLSYKEFTVDKLRSELSREWQIPKDQLVIVFDNTVSLSTKFRLPEGTKIGLPVRDSK